MKRTPPLALAILSTLALLSTYSLAQSGYYAITNNDPPGVTNSATIFKVEGKALKIVDNLPTYGDGNGGGTFDLPRLALGHNGSTECLFVADAGNSEVTSFRLDTLSKVGVGLDPQGNSTGFGNSMGLATSGKLLFVAYTTSANIGVFKISSGCGLGLLGTYNTASSVAGIRAAPNEKTLVVGYGYGSNEVDSFSIGSNGELTENGPYPAMNGAAGVDITADSKFAVFGDATGGTTQVEVYPINSDGTLGTETSFGGDGSLGSGQDSSSPWISPNGKFIFIANNLSKQVTSLGLTQSPLNVSYVGITTLQDSANIISIGGLTTASPSGNGGGIYVAEFSGDGLVGLLQINADGTTTEAPGSPFTNGVASSLLSVAAYPPRSY